MFDIGFSEILMILLVALIVIGPERLPKVARTLGHLWGRMQHYVQGVKRDISQSVELEELRELERMAKDEAEALERSVQQVSFDIDRDLGKLGRDLEQPLADAKQAALADASKLNKA